MTETIEELIKQRIKGGVFDDVVRKAALEPRKFKPKAAEVSLERPKEHLGEMYAKDYEQQVLRTTSAASAATAKKHSEVNDLLARLSGRLDTLFSFNNVPRAHTSEVTVKSAVAAVKMEDATPSTMASAEALAPEEVYAAKRGGAAHLADRSELSQEERKSLRRRDKRIRKRQGTERDEAEQLQAKLSPNSAAAKRLDARKAEAALAEAKRRGAVVEGVLNGKRGKASSGGNSGYSRSTQFFGSVQESTQSAGRARERGNKRGAAAAGLEAPGLDGQRLKL